MMIAFLVFKAINDLKITVEVGFVVGMIPQITPTGSAISVTPVIGSSPIIPTQKIVDILHKTSKFSKSKTIMIITIQIIKKSIAPKTETEKDILIIIIRSNMNMLLKTMTIIIIITILATTQIEKVIILKI